MCLGKGRSIIQIASSLQQRLRDRKVSSAFDVLRLITSSNCAGCSTGKSPGLAPLRILSTEAAASQVKLVTLALYAMRPCEFQEVPRLRTE